MRWLTIAPLLAATSACSTSETVSGSISQAVSVELPQRVTASWLLEGRAYELDLFAEGDALKGPLTVTEPSGESSVSSVRFPAGETGLPRPQIISRTDDGATILVDDRVIEMVIEERTDSHVKVRFDLPDLGRIDMRIEGDEGATDGAISTALGPVITVPVCGGIVAARIMACIYSDRCWTFTHSDGICFGSCQPCDTGGVGGGGGGGDEPETDAGAKEIEGTF